MIYKELDSPSGMSMFATAEVSADDLFENDGINWQYCMANAEFTHREACEFILHIYDEDEYHEQRVDEMRAFGCTEAFIECYNQAHKSGAYKVLFYA